MATPNVNTQNSISSVLIYVQFATQQNHDLKGHKIVSMYILTYYWVIQMHRGGYVCDRADLQQNNQNSPRSYTTHERSL